MGAFTEGFSQLRAGVVSWRRERERLGKDLARARETEMTAVSEMLASFSFMRAERARKMKAGLRGFVSHLRQTVAERRRAIRADMAGARRAWRALGSSAPRREPEVEKKKRGSEKG